MNGHVSAQEILNIISKRTFPAQVQYIGQLRGGHIIVGKGWGVACEGLPWGGRISSFDKG